MNYTDVLLASVNALCHASHLYLERALEILRHEESPFVNQPNLYNLSQYPNFIEGQKMAWRTAGITPAPPDEAACQSYCGGESLSIPANAASIFEHAGFLEFGRFQVYFRLEPRSCLLRL